MSEFLKKLTEFLDSEINDYSLAYEIGPIDDDGTIEVTTWRYGDNKNIIHEKTKNSTYWRWNNDNKSIEIEMGEDSWYEVKYYDWQVKYFWMMVAPYLFRM